MSHAVQIPHSPPEPHDSDLTFDQIGLPTAVVTALARNSITVPSLIQQKSIPSALAGRNVLGRAQTGSGKTLAFGLPMLAKLSQLDSRPNSRRPRALVLVPTRELAFQVVDSLTPYSAALGLSVRPAVGGTPFGKQADQLRKGIDILVATPGRLGDHLRQGTCILDEIFITALDEADQMADMGFLPEVRAILAETPKDSQRLLFSATLDNDVQSIVRQFLSEHDVHSTQDGRASVTTMDHYVLLVERGQKDSVLAEIGSREGRTIMFARTKLGCDGITERLRAVGVAAESLHGGKAQNQRTRVLERFKNGRTPVLVATDVAARGIHVDGVSLVVHVDPPADHKDYLHRAGRTARAGETGTVAAIVLPNQRRQFRKLTGMAGVDAQAIAVTAGSSQLAEITGAKPPTGEPILEKSPRNSDSRGGNNYRDDSRSHDGNRNQRYHKGSHRSQSRRPSDRTSFPRSNSEPNLERAPFQRNQRPSDRPERSESYKSSFSSSSRDSSRPTDNRFERQPRVGRFDRPEQNARPGVERAYRETSPRRSGGFAGNGNNLHRSTPASEAPKSRSGGFRSRTERRSYDGFDGPKRNHREPRQNPS
ncbi:MAG: DEAD/DEAH box helicase [Mycobacteriaceae bacterium]